MNNENFPHQLSKVKVTVTSNPLQKIRGPLVKSNVYVVKLKVLHYHIEAASLNYTCTCSN